MPAPRIGYRFVPMPMEIWDDPTCRNFTLAEFRLFGYLLRHQPPFLVGTRDITQDELLNGVWAANRKYRRDRGCGLTRNPMRQALNSLQRRGWIALEDISPTPKIPQWSVRLLFDRSEPEGVRFSSDLGESQGSVVESLKGPSNTYLDSNKKEPPISPQRGEKHVSSSESEKAQKENAGRIVRETIFPYYIKTVKPDGDGIYTLTKGRLSQGVLRMLETMDKCEGDWKTAEAMMKLAIDTMARSDFHMGLHPKTEGRKYNDWKYLFRTAEKLEEWFVRSEEDAHAQSSKY